MKITSTVFENNQPIPEKYTCKGDDVNPPLLFEEVPAEAKSLVLLVHDPDAPAKDWTHWLLYNMSPNVAFIKENSTPGTAEHGTNDSGTRSYSGPCPPSGTHRYYFKLFALDEKLDVPEEVADRAVIEEAMTGHTIAQAELIGTFQK